LTIHLGYPYENIHIAAPYSGHLMAKSPERKLFLAGFIENKHGRWFSVAHACVYGINAAIILSQIHYLTGLKIKMGEESDKNGFIWFYHSNEDFFRTLPFLSSKSIQRHLVYFEKLNIIQMKYERAEKCNKVRYIGLNYDELVKDFQSKWEEYRKNAKYPIEPIGEVMEDEKFHIPYSINFDQDKIFCKDKMSVQDSQKPVLYGQNVRTLYNIHIVVEYIYIHILAIFTQTCIKNTQFTKPKEIPVLGKMSFEHLWDFYHTLFAKRRERKKAAMQKYYKLTEEQRRVCFTRICHQYLFWCFDQKIAFELVDKDFYAHTAIKKTLQTQYVPFCRTFLDNLDPDEEKTYDDLKQAFEQLQRAKHVPKRDLDTIYAQMSRQAGIDPCALDVLN